jgi:hypothetical protein
MLQNLLKLLSHAFIIRYILMLNFGICLTIDIYSIHHVG